MAKDEVHGVGSLVIMQPPREAREACTAHRSGLGQLVFRGKKSRHPSKGRGAMA